MSEFKGRVFVAAAVAHGGYIPIVSPDDLLDPSIAAYVVVYADLHGERVINRRPLRVERVKDGVSITDAKGRRWDAVGVTFGNPRMPTLVRWADVEAQQAQESA